MKRIALALIACLWASLAFGQAPPRGLQQSESGSGNAGYPPGSTLTATAATATTGGITLPMTGVAGQFTYLCGFSISPGSATAAITLSVTLGNTALAATWFVGAPVTAAGTTGAIFTQTFTPCVRSNIVNQGPQLTVGALGAGGVNQAAQMWGYTQ